MYDFILDNQSPKHHMLFKSLKKCFMGIKGRFYVRANLILFLNLD